MDRPLPPDTDAWFDQHQAPVYRNRTQRVVLDIDYDEMREDPPSLWFWDRGVELTADRCRLVSAEHLIDGSPR